MLSMLNIEGNDEIIIYAKHIFNSKFDLKDLGLTDVILWITIIRTPNKIILS